MKYGVYAFWGFLCFAKDLVDLLACWLGKFRKHRNGVIWKLDTVPHCLMWGICRERNARTFEGNKSSIFSLAVLLDG